MPHITIIETGLVSPQFRERHGTYPLMFQRMMAAADQNVTSGAVSVANGETLPDPAGLDAILITGSSAGVYDDVAWVAPLEAFVRAAHDNGIPMVGVCFGHQLIAQALGGTVRKSEKGWGIGRHVYQIAPDNGLIEGREIAVACSHQDQVITPPASARTFMSSEFTPHAGLLYTGGTTMSVQPHPEFSADYADALCDLRRGRAPDDVIATAKASLTAPLDHARLGGVITRFLNPPRA
ncbi:gamma-glutamyl-gamma-aminobutyrate hydrolase family protein [Bradyrhizobium genosp. L]|uniref:type 1 glutamine amidotransferase n=1 Tax=Bradyrhizobium genosp. L TaxID=83637 RepID=UPI0018A2BA28|nr:gamma-glutamyl-gamma-aminobutyrate hydrolase family protein [Bradyrhizobium genosp. L]QPF86209.1 gamma-glutamyl-gamma-aminobutyrate hydrolase family protein [Bradyrhizobium genosp. L]